MKKKTNLSTKLFFFAIIVAVFFFTFSRNIIEGLTPVITTANLTPADINYINTILNTTESCVTEKTALDAAQTTFNAEKANVQTRFNSAQAAAQTILNSAQFTAQTRFNAEKVNAQTRFNAAQAAAQNIFNDAQAAAQTTFNTAQAAAQTTFNTAQAAFTGCQTRTKNVNNDTDAEKIISIKKYYTDYEKINNLKKLIYKDELFSPNTATNTDKDKVGLFKELINLLLNPPPTMAS